LHDLDAMTVVFACTRAIHMSACLLAMAVYFFDRFVAGGDKSHWPRIASRLLFLALSLALISGVGWFACVAISMSGLPFREALGLENLSTVWTQTQFGHLWKARGILLGVCVIVSLAANARGKVQWRFWFPLPVLRERDRVRAFSQDVAVRPSPQPSPGVPGEGARKEIANPRTRGGILMWFGLVVTASLVSSLAWAGHGRYNDSHSHLAIDASHLLVSAVWPVGLLPFAMILTKLRAEAGAEKWIRIWEITRRFSNISLGSVILLTISGILNSWPLVGSIDGLLSTPYGRVLLIKIGLFAVMVAIGAVNLFYLMPHMPHRAVSAPDAVARKTPFRLQINVEVEIALGVLVMLAVGVLGLLMPAVEHLLMMHQ